MGLGGAGGPPGRLWRLGAGRRRARRPRPRGCRGCSRSPPRPRWAPSRAPSSCCWRRTSAARSAPTASPPGWSSWPWPAGSRCGCCSATCPTGWRGGRWCRMPVLTAVVAARRAGGVSRPPCSASASTRSSRPSAAGSPRASSWPWSAARSWRAWARSTVASRPQPRVDARRGAWSPCCAPSGVARAADPPAPGVRRPRPAPPGRVRPAAARPHSAPEESLAESLTLLSRRLAALLRRHRGRPDRRRRGGRPARDARDRGPGRRREPARPAAARGRRRRGTRSGPATGGCSRTSARRSGRSCRRWR